MDRILLAAICLTPCLLACIEPASGSLSPPCHVRIQGEMLPVQYMEEPRNNPDGTHYPGDSFYYLIWFSGSPTCVGMRVSPLGVTDGLDIADAAKYVDPGSASWFRQKASEKCSRSSPYSGCVYGRAVVNNEAPGRCNAGYLPDGLTYETCTTTGQSIKQTVTWLKKVCTISDGKIKCRIVPIVRTVTLRPEIVGARINLVMEERVLNDTDGYAARNLDETYYAWDPQTIQHIPYMKWKNERNNTLHFDIVRESDLRLEATQDCHVPMCTLPLERPGYITSYWELDRGAGMAIFNATGDYLLGLNDITYLVSATNAGLEIASASGTLRPLTVAYGPVYVEYPYPLLADDMRTSYEDRAAVALHYFGSRGTGPDDEDVLHEDRRSKINGHYYAGFGMDPWRPVTFWDPLAWSEAVPVPPRGHHRGVQESQHPDAAITGHPGVVPCAVDPDTAMIRRAGYCKIYFEYDILDTVVGPSGPIYENATLFNTLLSKGFAGRETWFVSHYQYRFPEPLLHTVLHVTSLGRNGTIHPVEIHANVSAAGPLLSSYMHEKVLYDTDDPGLAGIISGDVHPEEYSASGTGELSVKLRRISAKFETYQDAGQNLRGLDITDLAHLYIANSKSARLDVPLDVGLGSLSPLSVNVTAGGTTRQFDYPYIDFGTDFRIDLNVADDNVLEITRRPGSATVSPGPGFGHITALYVDGTKSDAPCGRTCTLVYHDPSEALVTAENAWGGTASGMLPAYAREEDPGLPSDPIPLVLFVLSMIPAYWMYRRIQRSGKYGAA